MAKGAFESILDRPSVDAKPPRPLPKGHYLCAVKGNPRFDKSSKKGTDFVEFTLQPVEARDDVDEDELKALKGGIKGRTIRATYYLTDDAEWRLTKFLNDCGIPQEDEDGNKLTHSQRIAEINGAEVIAQVRHRPSESGDVFYVELGSTAPVEE